MERYFPKMICKLLMGEEKSNFIEPLLYSRLINPMVNNGI